MAQELELAHGLQFEDLYARDGVARIDELFVDYLGQSDGALKADLIAGRANATEMTALEESKLLLRVAPYVDDFVGVLFGIAKPVLDRAHDHHALARGFACRRLFVQRVALKKIKKDEAVQLDGSALEQDLISRMGKPFSEATYADSVMSWMDDGEANAENLDVAARYASWRVHTGGHNSSVLFKEPKRVDPQDLIPTIQEKSFHDIPVKVMSPDHLRQRPGFKLTDDGGGLADCLSEGHYCIFCHNQGKDSCSTGLIDKKTEAFKESAFGVELVGCPLDEKISEMHVAKTDGHFVGALAIAIVDNPMIAGTGHRICNECMKACIYQKQDPVDIPKGETRTLRDVLELPWGFEIYSLLTRWNPLNLRRPVPLEPSGYKVLVVGLGPAGFTLAHHLMNDGHTVAAIDGAKIEPVNPEYSGVTALGERVAFKPVYDIKELHEELDDRVMAGFGGVAEYGITVRWDKNFL